MLRRDERRGRRVQRADHGVDFRRHCPGDLAGQPQRFPALVQGPEKQPELHDRVDLVQGELEGGDHAEVAAAAADGPEQVRVLTGRGPPHPAVGGDHLGRDQVVDAEPVFAGQPAHAAAQREPGHAGVADQPGGHGQPVGRAAASRSASSAPPPARARRAAGSTRPSSAGSGRSSGRRRRRPCPPGCARRRARPPPARARARSRWPRPRRQPKRTGRSPRDAGRSRRSTPGARHRSQGHRARSPALPSPRGADRSLPRPSAS